MCRAQLTEGNTQEKTQMKPAIDIFYKKGYKYQLTRPVSFPLLIYPDQNIHYKYLTFLTTGVLSIDEGYAWDGPSGPTFDTRNSMVAALIHDALYQLMRQGLLGQEWREPADKLLYSIAVWNGMNKFRAGIWYRMVRRLAAPAASPNKLKKEHHATHKAAR